MLAQLLASTIGIWLTAAPSILGYGGSAAMSHQVAGPLVASLGLISAWDVTRELRWANVASGAWLIIAPVVLGHGGVPGANSIACGLLVFVLSSVPGRRRWLGGRWRSLRRSAPRPG